MYSIVGAPVQSTPGTGPRLPTPTGGGGFHGGGGGFHGGGGGFHGGGFRPGFRHGFRGGFVGYPYSAYYGYPGYFTAGCQRAYAAWQSALAANAAPNVVESLKARFEACLYSYSGVTGPGLLGYGGYGYGYPGFPFGVL